MLKFDRVLVADDDDLCRDLLVETLKSHQFDVVAVKDGREAIEQMREQAFDLVITDLVMPEADGIQVLQEVQRINRHTPVILTTAFGTLELAVRAMRAGANDLIIKPFSPDQIDLTLERLQRAGRLNGENEYLRNELEAESLFVGEHRSVKELLSTVQTVAKSKATVFVRGESGTGKELVARLIHRLSPRHDKAFIRVNCAALSETLLESELFGHEKGAFTGAIQKRQGRFELADGGTLLLDEISEIAPTVQAKLLRVLEEEEFERVGGTRTLKVDVRIIATSNRDLAQAVDEGSFRPDLLYRLNVVPLLAPPLRDRTSDITFLAEHFIRIYAAQNGLPVPSLSREANEALQNYSWPGNVRELRNVIHRAVVLNKGNELGAELFSLDSLESQSQPHVQVGMTLAEVERELILKTLSEHEYNRTAAAKVLGLTSRTLTNKIRLYRSQGFEIKGGRSLYTSQEAQ